MTLPASWATVTVTGTYLDLDGSPMSGAVAFEGLVYVIVEADKVIVAPSTLTATLDGSGAFSLTLPASNDPDVTPSFSYVVREQLTGLRERTYQIVVPHDVASVDLTELISSPTATTAETVNLDARYARKAAANTFSQSQTLASTFDGGDDTFDSTSRLNLESYQSSPINAFGETIRNFMRKAKAKAMQAWYFPSGGYDANLDPVGTMQPAVWAGAHWRSGDGNSLHKHWSVEVQDASGALQTRFEVVFGDQSDDAAIAGLDKTFILTNLADFVVRCSNGQALRLAANDADEKALEWTQDTAGVVRRWKLRATSGLGDLQFARYDDVGAFLDGPLIIKRSTGRVGVGVSDPTDQLHVGGDARVDGDLEFLTGTTGPLLTDRTTGTQYRLFVDNGSLQIESLP